MQLPPPRHTQPRPRLLRHPVLHVVDLENILRNAREGGRRRSVTAYGKSYLACALAKAVIDNKHSVRYLRLPRLGEELALLQAQGRISHWLKTLGRIDLLILEDLGLVPLSPSHQPLLLELLEDRQQRGSVIVTSQLPVKLWHGQFQDPTLADAILDRLVHNAELVELTGESMRKKQHRNPANGDNPEAAQ